MYSCTHRSFLLQVLYIVTDPDYPAPAALLEHTAKEMAFMAEYLNRTGIQWRHYYGPNGPRPPPAQFMWPAAHIGQVHSVTSNEGFWYVAPILNFRASVLLLRRLIL
jgi:hypothetical protein